MVRKIFIKEISEMNINFWDKVEDKLFYNTFAINIRHFCRFLKRFPNWLKLCWKTEDWDYEGIYDFLEMQLKQMKKAQEEDIWHAQKDVNRSIKQLNLVLEHLKRYRDPFKYYDFPEITLVKSGHMYNGEETYTTKFIDEEDGQKKFDYFEKMEQKHFDKFWNLLKKWHKNWWT